MAWDEAVWSATSRSVEFRIEVLRGCGPVVCGELILAALEHLGAGRRGIGWEHLESLWLIDLGENIPGENRDTCDNGAALRDTPLLTQRHIVIDAVKRAKFGDLFFGARLDKKNLPLLHTGAIIPEPPSLINHALR